MTQDQLLYAAIGITVLAFAVLGAALVLILRGHQDWANTPPVEFSAACSCGHRFDEHGSASHGVGSPCRAVVGDSWGCSLICTCEAFEPQRTSPDYDVKVYLDHDQERLVLLPSCRHSTYAVDVEGSGGPLRCAGCGEELP
jgi:hypothetical protein